MMAKNEAKTAAQTEAQKLIAQLRKWGMTNEGIAFHAHVSLNTILRWAKGVSPHPGHLASLREAVEGQRALRKKNKVAAA